MSTIERIRDERDKKVAERKAILDARCAQNHARFVAACEALSELQRLSIREGDSEEQRLVALNHVLFVKRILMAWHDQISSEEPPLVTMYEATVEAMCLVTDAAYHTAIAEEQGDDQ